jgi:hypothetical protein
MELNEAAETLARLGSTEDPRSRSRLRRAIARLAAYGWDRASGRISEPYRTALKSALPPVGLDVAQMEQSIQAYAGTHRTGEGEYSVVNLESQVMDLPELRALTGSCNYEKVYQAVSPPGPDGGGITILAMSTIPREPAMVRQAMDPQRWDECSQFWCPNGTCFVPSAPAMANRDACEVENRVPQEEVGEPPGSPYPWRIVFERFSCSVDLCDSLLCNTLKVMAEEIAPPIDDVKGHCIELHTPPDGWPVPKAPEGAPKSYRLDYQLDHPLGGRVLGVAQSVWIDQGCAQVDDQGKNAAGETQALVFGHKLLQLENSWTEQMLHAVLLASAEVAGSQVEMACCMPPPCARPAGEPPCN